MAQNAVTGQLRKSSPAHAIISETPALLFIVTVIFAAETGLMLVIAIVHERLTVWQQALIDAMLLILLLLPALYLLHLFTFRPLRLHNAKLLQFRMQMEEQISECREAESALRRSEHMLHLLSAQLLSVQEKERQHLSCKLHEEFGQCLISLKLRLKLLVNAIPPDQPAAQEELRCASEQIDDMVQQIRQLSRHLTPAILKDLGFSPAARRLVSSFAGDSGLDATVTFDDGIDPFLKGPDGIHTYRILQEALENVQRHAEARRVAVSVTATERELSLVVEDDGKGFDCREKGRGLGLVTMYERARLLNGSLDLCSEPGAGTKIILRIPKQRDSKPTQ